VRSAELAPALVAVGGGGALLGAIAVHEHRRDAAMRSSRQAYSLVFPIGTDSNAALSALSSLTGLGHGFELVAEVAADESGIHHLVHLPAQVATSVIDQLGAHLPGLRLDPVEPRSTGPVTTSVRFMVPVRALLRTDDAAQGSNALLSGLASLKAEERVSLRWALRPSDAPTPPKVLEAQPVSLKAKAEQRAWRTRIGLPGYTTAGLLLVRAHTDSRAGELTRHVNNVVRSRRGLGNGLLIRRGRVRSASVMPKTGRSRGWLSAPELLPLLGWPLGKEPVQGVELGAARRLPIPRDLPRQGRALFIGRDPYGQRPVVLSREAARHHVAVVGPSGTGKSTLLTRSVLSDLENGYGGVVIDPKADLVADILERVPEKHAERIVVLDPSTRGPVPGLDLLGVGDPDLRSDVVLGALGAIFKDSWGVRTDTYLRLGLRTLSELEQPVLTDWLRLFTDPHFRHQTVARLEDPLLVGAWQSYEALTIAEQNQHVAAPMSKVISLLARPAVRGVLAQRNPKLDISRLLAERKWLLVSLSPGTLGEPASKLLGAILTYAVWTAVEERAALAKEQRRPVFLYLDELQSLANLPFGVEYLFERARGLGCGLTVAIQATSRLPESVRQSMLGNVGSLVTFRLGYEEATRIARELPGLASQDLQSLRQFEVAARIGTGVGSGIATVTGRTEPLPPPTGQAVRIRQLSAEHYGQEVATIDAELRAHQRGEELPNDAPLGRTRRLP
jgi:type IV secretion system coupling TraD/TrwB family protein